MAEYTIKGHKQIPEPQETIHSIWNEFFSKTPGFIRTILPAHTADDGNGSVSDGIDTTEHEGSFEAARRACILQVTAIIRECYRTNEMFTDPEFDVQNDFLTDKHECLFPLPVPEKPKETTPKRDEKDKTTAASELNICTCARLSQTSDPHRTAKDERAQTTTFDGSWIQSVRRIQDIFENPSFAPGASRKRMPPLDKDGSVWRADIPHWAAKTRQWLQVLLTAVICLRLLGFLSTSVLLMSGVLVGLLIAACLLIHSLAERSLGPNFSSSDISQGSLGNCWWIAAVAALCTRNDLLRRICLAWDQDCGVYGFVFYRDGSWVHTVVDDCLYLEARDDTLPDEETPQHSKSKKGSSLLFFGSCGKLEYTWLPLLEKAYAKVHGDYKSLRGGNPAEGIEDITGGVSSALRTQNVRSRDDMWHELCHMKSDHVYALSTSQDSSKYWKVGIMSRHAYSIEKVCTFYFDGWWPKKTRLLKIRNPWGSMNGLWEGTWGAKSIKWSLLSMWWLQFRSSDKSVFYMTYEDAVKSWDKIYRLRIFDNVEWTTRQLWTSMNVDWIPQFNSVYFELQLEKKSEVVLAVSQLDSRYFCTLEGRHIFHLELLIKRKGASITDFIAKSAVRALHDNFSDRSASIETHLQEGVYEALVKVTAIGRRDKQGDMWTPEDIVKQSLHKSRKLQQIARNYDTAYRKLRTVTPSALGGGNESDAETSKQPGSDGETVTKVHPEALEVKWQAVCGVGLRVFSKDPEMHLELRHRNDDYEAARKSSDSGDQNPGSDDGSDCDWTTACDEDEFVWNKGRVDSVVGFMGVGNGVDEAEVAEDFYQNGS